jgi:3-isopropylmalate dehydratase small subunit
MTVSHEILDALKTVKASEGRIWKSKLRDMWMNCQYDGYDDISHLLQQARNTIGPSALNKVKV